VTGSPLPYDYTKFEVLSLAQTPLTLAVKTLKKAFCPSQKVKKSLTRRKLASWPIKPFSCLRYFPLIFVIIFEKE